MRAVLVKGGAGGVENLFIGDAPKPAPTAGQVLVKVCPILYARSDEMYN
jgi:NADPH:quinone reductase-like Zn-dependent oxidoreductase